MDGGLGLQCGRGCWWYQATEGGRGRCRFRPPVAGVVGTMEPGLGGMDGSMQAETVWPIVRAAEPGCAQHPGAGEAVRKAREGTR